MNKKIMCRIFVFFFFIELNPTYRIARNFCRSLILWIPKFLHSVETNSYNCERPVLLGTYVCNVQQDITV